jgi:hypothetical protein
MYNNTAGATHYKITKISTIPDFEGKSHFKFRGGGGGFFSERKQ